MANLSHCISTGWLSFIHASTCICISAAYKYGVIMNNVSGAAVLLLPLFYFPSTIFLSSNLPFFIYLQTEKNVQTFDRAHKSCTSPTLSLLPTSLIIFFCPHFSPSLTHPLLSPLICLCALTICRPCVCLITDSLHRSALGTSSVTCLTRRLAGRVWLTTRHDETALEHRVLFKQHRTRFKFHRGF